GAGVQLPLACLVDLGVVPPAIAHGGLLGGVLGASDFLLGQVLQLGVAALGQQRQAFVPVAFDQAQILAGDEVGLGVVGLLGQRGDGLLGALEFLLGDFDVLGALADQVGVGHQLGAAGGGFGDLQRRLGGLEVVGGDGVINDEQAAGQQC